MKPNVQGRRVPDVLDSEEAGVFAFEARPHARFVDRPDKRRIRFNCPCGCGGFMSLPVYLSGEPKPAPNAWEWNGNEERPTLTPSIRDMSGCRFHGHLTDGVWTFCADSGVKT